MPDRPKGSADLDAFVADLNRHLAERFADWPEGCIVRGPAVEPIEIDTMACYIGLPDGERG